MTGMKQVREIIMLMALVISTDVIAHTTIVKKNTPDGYATRSELEGSSGVLNFLSIPHGCAAPGSAAAQPVRAQSVVFPNGEFVAAVRGDNAELLVLSEEIEGNAIMSPKPVQDYNIYKKINVKNGRVPLFVSHGEKTTDVRAFHYTEGRLETYLLGLVPFRSSFPKFKSASCANSLRINIAIANYCTHSARRGNRADIWIGHLTKRFDDPGVVSVDFWPYINVIRDLENNPLPSDCGKGYEIIVTPSDQTIDQYLPIPGFWPAN